VRPPASPTHRRACFRRVRVAVPVRRRASGRSPQPMRPRAGELAPPAAGGGRPPIPAAPEAPPPVSGAAPGRRPAPGPAGDPRRVERGDGRGERRGVGHDATLQHTRGVAGTGPAAVRERRRQRANGGGRGEPAPGQLGALRQAVGDPVAVLDDAQPDGHPGRDTASVNNSTAPAGRTPSSRAPGRRRAGGGVTPRGYARGRPPRTVTARPPRSPPGYGCVGRATRRWPGWVVLPLRAAGLGTRVGGDDAIGGTGLG
jgi:translation initiation factor IF-2